MANPFTDSEVRDLKRLLAKKLGIPRFRQKLLLAEDHSVCGDDESQVVPGTLQLLGFYTIKIDDLRCCSTIETKS